MNSATSVLSVIGASLGVLSVVVWGAPLPPMQPLTIEGTIERVYWSPDTPIPGVPGLSGSAGKDRVDPAHFQLRLRNYTGTTPAEAWRLNGLLAESPLPDTDRQRLPPHLVLKLDHNDPHALLPGMRIRVGGYVLSGDEGGTWSHRQSLKVLSWPGRPPSGPESGDRVLLQQPPKVSKP